MIIEALPQSLTLILAEAALLIVGVVAEKYYVSRLSIFTNAIALTVHYLSREQIGFWTELYIDIAIILGIIGIVAYTLERSLNTYYYHISYFLFSSINVGLVIGLSSYSLVIPIALGIGIQLLLLAIYEGDNLVHNGKYSGSIKRFHQKNTLVYENHQGQQKFDFSEWF